MNKYESVLIIASYKSLYGGNFIASLKKLYERITINGIECVLVFPKQAQTREWYRELIEDNIKVKVYSEKHKNKTVRELINQYNHALVHFHHFSYIDSLKITIGISRKRLKKIVLHIHSDFNAGKRQSFFMTLYNRIKYSFYPKRYSFVSVIKKHSITYKNVQYVENAIVFDRLKVLDSNPIKEKLGIDINTKLIVIFAWSPYVKGLDIAIKAVENMVSNEKLCLGIVYGRENSIDQLSIFIKENTNTSPLESWIKFLPPTDSVQDYYNAADIFLSASRSEGFSYAICEALYMNKICVISDIESTSWASKYANTIQFSASNVEDCTRALEISLAATPQNISSSLQRDYGISKWITQILSIYGLELKLLEVTRHE